MPDIQTYPYDDDFMIFDGVTGQYVITARELQGMPAHAEVLTAHRMSGKSLGQSKIIIIIKVNVEL